MQQEQNIVRVEPPPPSKLPPLIAKTMNVCVNCVQAPGRMVAKAATRRYHKHYHARHRFGRHHLVADIAMAAGILALLGVNAWFILGKPALLPSNVQLAWDAPVAARVGDAVSLALTVAYEGNEPLDRATLALTTSEGFSITQVLPGSYDAVTHTLTLPTPIAPGASIGVTVAGVVEQPSDRDLTLTATFHGTGASGSERQSAKTSVAVRGVAIVFELEAPPVVPANGVVGLRLRYDSEASLTMRDIVISPTSDLPVSDVGGDHGGSGPTVFPKDIAPREHGELRFEVRTKGEGTFPLSFTVFHKTTGGVSVALGGFSSPLTVVRVPVYVGIAVQDHGSSLVHLGETIPIIATYAGESGAEMPRGYSHFSVRGKGALLQWSHLDPQDAREFEPGDETMLWMYAPAAAGKNVSRTFALTIPSSVDGTRYRDDTTFAYTFTPSLILFNHMFEVYAAVEGKPLVLNVVGDINLTSSGRYFTPEGDQIGRGPLPPRVGETTRYWVTWDLRATIQDAGRTVVRAVVPPGVEWTGRVATTAGDGVVYDAATRTITWTVDAVPRTIGSTYPNVSASFELALTPDASMIGRPAKLLGESIADGTDALGKSLRAVAPAVTTELTQDSRARGKGRVEENKK